ncbi:MAG: Ig-like domain-containing protein [Gemmatimonadota bacterium]|nr:Ig-like domain-containing protein [Gemmatimonadota bacterium]
MSDLSVSDTSDVSATLVFSQVDNGIDQAANYDLRYAVPPMSWPSATPAASGTCKTPVAGTGVSGTLTCTVLGLSPSTSYNFQLIAFRGTLNANAVVGGLSNVAAASTKASPQVVATVDVAPSSASIAVGATVGLQATVKDAQGNVMNGHPVTWSSSNAAAATVNSSGVVTGVAAGSATITAMSASKSGTASVTVTSAPPPSPVVTTVTVAPASASIAVGATVALTATVWDQQGNVMTGQTVTWSTNNAAAATVSSDGVVTGVAAGSATITATSTGKSGTSSITVTAPPPPPPPPGGTLLFQENFEDANLASRGWYDNTNVLLSTTE